MNIGLGKVDPCVKNTRQTRAVILRTPYPILSWIFCIFYDLPSPPQPDICILKKKCPGQNDQLIESCDFVYSVFWPLEKKNSFFFDWKYQSVLNQIIVLLIYKTYYQYIYIIYSNIILPNGSIQRCLILKIMVNIRIRISIRSTFSYQY